MLTVFGRPFAGGVHPPTYKYLTKSEKSSRHFLPKKVYLSLVLRNGSPLTPLVSVGDVVKKGELIATGLNDMTAPLHSSVNGVVVEIKPHITTHPGMHHSPTIVIETDGNRGWGTYHPSTAVNRISSEMIIERVRDAGVVGLGGAGFPTAKKIEFARKAGVHTLVINGGECEPYLTCDDRLMQEYGADVIGGIRLLLKATGAAQAIIGIEDNKREAIEFLSSLCEEDNINVEVVPSLYPMGSERHLIKAVTGQTVPLGKLSTEIGIVVNNVATAKAVYHAVRYQHPLVSRMVTVSGLGVETPMNVDVPIGTTVRELLAYCGGFHPSTERLILGGPMMGSVVTSPDVPLDKSAGGLLALTTEEMKERERQSCIRCGQCVRACPMGLMPFKIASFSRVSDFKGAESNGVNHCLSCGACSYICPSSIPLVQFFQHTKGVLRSRKMQEDKTERVRQLRDAKAIRMAKEAELKKAAKAAKPKRRRQRRDKEVS